MFKFIREEIHRYFFSSIDYRLDLIVKRLEREDNKIGLVTYDRLEEKQKILWKEVHDKGILFVLNTVLKPYNYSIGIEFI